jgi:hypothetical protein
MKYYWTYEDVDISKKQFVYKEISHDNDLKIEIKEFLRRLEEPEYNQVVKEVYFYLLGVYGRRLKLPKYIINHVNEQYYIILNSLALKDKNKDEKTSCNWSWIRSFYFLEKQ